MESDRILKSIYNLLIKYLITLVYLLVYVVIFNLFKLKSFIINEIILVKSHQLEI